MGVKIAIIPLPDLDNAVNMSDQDECAANVQQGDDTPKLCSQDIRLDAASMEHHL